MPFLLYLLELQGNFVLLAKSGISTTGTTAVVGNVGVSPAAASFITGFGPVRDLSNEFSGSSLVNGRIYAADYAPPIPTLMTAAIEYMQTAYTNAAGRVLPDHTELGAGNIDGITLSPGLYKWSTGVTTPTGVTLSGNANDVWIFQIAQDLTVGDGAKITLSNGAQPQNVFWQVAGQATLGTTAQFKGIILSQTAIALNTGATLDGRALTQTAVTLDANRVSVSALSVPGILTPVRDVEEKISDSLPSSTNRETSDEEELRFGGNSDETQEEIIKRINLRTNLTMSLDEDETLGKVLRAHLSNGRYALVKVLPAQASATAQAKLNLTCFERNCTVELKEHEVKKEKKLFYEVKMERKSKLFGFIKAQQKVRVDIDAETGTVIKTHIPWWAFLAREEKE